MLPVGVAMLAVAVHGRSFRPRMLLGAITGVCFYGTSLSWLADFAVVGWIGVAAVETVMLALAVAVVPTAQVGRWAGGWWALPGGMVLLEAAQERFPFDGFPLPALAHGQLDGPFAFAAPLGGSLLVTAVGSIAGVAIAALVLARGRVRLLSVTLAAGLVAACLALGAAVNTRSLGNLDIAVVQGGGPRGQRAVFTDPRLATDRQFAVADQITGSPDLVLLPETVIRVEGSVAGSPGDARVAALARRLNALVVAGVAEIQDRRFRNVAVLWGPDGRILGRYEKEHRVPFGEYLPARPLIERLTDSAKLVPRDAIVGEDAAVLPAPATVLGVVISYEVLFSDRVREAVAAGGQVVLVPTNAASYVTDEVPAIEVAAARMRAREYGRTVVQSAPTGYSVIVAPDGRVVAQSGLASPALLRAAVSLRDGNTFYAAVGEIPLLVVAAVVVALAGTAGTRGRRHSLAVAGPTT